MRTRDRFTLIALLVVIASLMTILPASGRSPEAATEPMPPEMAYLKRAPAGRDFSAFLEEATIESERFRRRLLAGDDPDHIRADLIAEAIVAFQRRAPRHLSKHKDIDAFALSKEMIVAALAGGGRIASGPAYGGFQGQWYGLWDTMRVDHDWSQIVELDEPRRVAIAGKKPVWIRSYQYCWVGDGYGVNMIATADPGSSSGDFLLAYVVHVERGDPDKPTKRRPHVGLFVGDGKLIWITAGEVFLEETYDVSPGVEAYAITGFFYKATADLLRARQCFQAVYTRQPDQRSPWLSFPLELTVSR